MEIKKQTINERMKEYEHLNRNYLDTELPIIMRLDGKNFSKYTKQFEKPFSDLFIDLMNQTAVYVCSQIQGAVLGYTQSDEITIYIKKKEDKSQIWFDGNIQKMTSIAASYASTYFNSLYFKNYINDTNKMITMFDNLACFDARVFNVPSIDEVMNCFIWRQLDCKKNSISSVAQCNFSPKELHGKHESDQLEMLNKINIDWTTFDKGKQIGRIIYKEITYSDVEYTVNGEINIAKNVLRKCWKYNNAFYFLDNKQDLLNIITNE